MRRVSDQLRGNGNGAIIVTLFGAAWIGVAVHEMPASLIICALLPALLLVAWGVNVVRAANRLRASEPPLNPAEATAESVVGKRFAWIFGAEGVAILIAVNVLANIGKSAFLLPTIGVIVGLHFLPLAKLFQYRLYFWLGILQVALCLGTALALRSRVAALNTAVGLEMGLTLWITVLAVLIRARRFRSLLASKLPV